MIICGDNQIILASYPESHFSACITDPPYGLGMDTWDYDVPPVQTWKEVYRVLKPGAFVASFCAPRYYHRMAVNVEDAGFVPRDMVVWIVTTKMAVANGLKPAHEPIFIAQKPLDGTLTNNISLWGCGKVRTDENRIPWGKKPPTGWVKNGHNRRVFGGAGNTKGSGAIDGTVDADPRGRVPSNVVGIFDDAEHQKYFYAPRVTRKERGEGNDHPTPKPIDLMRWLIRLYAPAVGIVLDPYCGSGSTGIAAQQEHLEFVGIDLDSHYCDVAKTRLVSLFS